MKRLNPVLLDSAGSRPPLTGHWQVIKTTFVYEDSSLPSCLVVLRKDIHSTTVRCNPDRVLSKSP